MPEIAADVCNCFVNIEKNLSKETKLVFANAAKADNPSEKLQEEMAKLSKEDQVKVLSEMTFFNGMEDEKSPVGQCIKNVEKKYGYTYTKDKKKLGEKLVKELESKSGCDFTASIWKLGLKLSDKK